MSVPLNIFCAGCRRKLGEGWRHCEWCRPPAAPPERPGPKLTAAPRTGLERSAPAPWPLALLGLVVATAWTAFVLWLASRR